MMGLKLLGKIAAVAERDRCTLISNGEWGSMDSPFSFCAQHRAHHVDVRLVVLQPPDGLLSVEAVHLQC
jgi:hypothetical protein